MQEMRLTASNLVSAINRLPKGQLFEYINQRNKGKVRVASVTLPEGPISIYRGSSKKAQSISSKMLWRLANAMQPNIPVNVDRVFAGSYNTRSVLETLLGHSPEFYWCTPGRIELENSTQDIKKGHKHLVWRPDHHHKNGVLEKFETDMVISEIPSSSAIYEALQFPKALSEGLDINVTRRHLQIQIALVAIGHQLGFRTWIARNDQGLTYNKKRIGELDGIIVKLEDEKLLTAWDQSIQAAIHIDCIWFRNGKFMPAVIEVEHSTGIDSGLTRMKRLKDQIPAYTTRWVIVAPDEDREKVMTKASRPLYSDMNVRFFPYSAVDELYALCQRRKLTNKAVNEEFLDCFMETVPAAISVN
jgi:type II restriction enzyme